MEISGLVSTLPVKVKNCTSAEFNNFTNKDPYSALNDINDEWLFQNKGKILEGTLDKITNKSDFVNIKKSIDESRNIRDTLKVDFDILPGKIYDSNGNLTAENTSFELSITGFNPYNAPSEREKFKNDVIRSGFNHFKDIKNNNLNPICLGTNQQQSLEESQKKAIIQYLENKYNGSTTSGSNTKTGNQLITLGSDGLYRITVSKNVNARCKNIFGCDWDNIVGNNTTSSTKQRQLLRTTNSSSPAIDNSDLKKVSQVILLFSIVKKSNQVNTINNDQTACFLFQVKSLQFSWGSGNKPHWLTNNDTIRVSIASTSGDHQQELFVKSTYDGTCGTIDSSSSSSSNVSKIIKN